MDIGVYRTQGIASLQKIFFKSYPSFELSNKSVASSFAALRL